MNDPEYRARSVAPISEGSNQFQTRCPFEFCGEEIVFHNLALHVEYQSKCGHTLKIETIRTTPPRLMIYFCHPK